MPNVCLADKLQIDSCDFQAPPIAAIYKENTPIRSQYKANRQQLVCDRVLVSRLGRK